MDRFDLTLSIAVRHVEESDLTLLEWDGMMTPFRETMQRAFARTHAGEVLYLIADLKGYPVGQVQIDLVAQSADQRAVIWALRVILPLQNHGIGTALMHSAETLIRARGFSTIELNVAKDNPAAQRLYERLGYRIVADKVARWSYTTPEGETRQVEDIEWVMHKRLS